MPFTRYACLLFVFALMQVFPAQVAQARTEGGFTKLSNGRNLDAFDTFIRDLGLNNDINRVFRVHDDMIHVSGKQYGYFITKKEYENYHLKLEFKWGVKTHAPRKNRARDSGILFHVEGPDKVWPKSVEFQMIEGRTGEVILVGNGSSFTVDGETKTRTEGGGSSRFARRGQGPWRDEVGYRDPVGEVENPHGQWNLLELISDHGKVTYKVNDKVVIEGSKPVPSRGRILFQSEGAELFFRNIEIRVLD